MQPALAGPAASGTTLTQESSVINGRYIMAASDKAGSSVAVDRSGRDIECWLTDMNGVLVLGLRPLTLEHLPGRAGAGRQGP